MKALTLLHWLAVHLRDRLLLAAFTAAMSQALGSGRLQGDEFRSIAEQVPGILKLVSDEMGVTVG